MSIMFIIQGICRNISLLICSIDNDVINRYHCELCLPFDNVNVVVFLKSITVSFNFFTFIVRINGYLNVFFMRMKTRCKMLIINEYSFDFSFIGVDHRWQTERCMPILSRIFHGFVSAR